MFFLRSHKRSTKERKGEKHETKIRTRIKIKRKAYTERATESERTKENEKSLTLNLLHATSFASLHLVRLCISPYSSFLVAVAAAAVVVVVEQRDTILCDIRLAESSHSFMPKMYCVAIVCMRARCTHTTIIYKLDGTKEEKRLVVIILIIVATTTKRFRHQHKHPSNVYQQNQKRQVDSGSHARAHSEI